MPIGKLDPVAMYLKHAENWLFLNFVITRTKVFADKMQALKEIKICERKLDYWYRMIDDVRDLTLPLQVIKSKWEYTGAVNGR